jgi:hypothetical protein
MKPESVLKAARLIKIKKMGEVFEPGRVLSESMSRCIYRVPGARR